MPSQIIYRCTASCCELPHDFGHQELCTKSTSPILVGQSPRLCCKNGYVVSVYGVPTKSTRFAFLLKKVDLNIIGIETVGHMMFLRSQKTLQ